jgi:hypothetical protein
MRLRDVAARVGIRQRAAQMSMKSRDGNSEVAISSSKNETRDVVPHNIARPGLCRPEGRFTKPLFGFAAAILVQLPRSTRAFVIGIWHGTPPTLRLH